MDLSPSTLHTETRANTKVPQGSHPTPRKTKMKRRWDKKLEGTRRHRCPTQLASPEQHQGHCTVPPLTFKRWAQGREGFQEDPHTPQKPKEGAILLGMSKALASRLSREEKQMVASH